MPMWSEAIGRMQKRMEDTRRRVGSAYPHWADPETGAWTTSADGDWTGGFWAGPIRHVRVKLLSEADKTLFFGWWKIAKPTDQAHQQRPIFNCDHVSPTGKVRCRTGNEYERFAGVRFGSAEVRRAVSCVQADFSFLRRGKSDGCKPLPSPVCSARRVNYQIRLDRT